MFEKFKEYVSRHGAPQTALILGYSDTHSIKNWIHNGEIPSKMEEPVRLLLKTTVTINRPA